MPPEIHIDIPESAGKQMATISKIVSEIPGATMSVRTSEKERQERALGKKGAYYALMEIFRETLNNDQLNNLVEFEHSQGREPFPLETPP